jgi:hypothetical protein
MWWFFKTIVLSILCIILLHYGWDYLKNTYSTHKTKDIAKIHSEKYDTILSEVLKSKSTPDVQIDLEDMEKDLATFMENTITGTQLSYE